jgi:hypothetical protein
MTFAVIGYNATGSNEIATFASKAKATAFFRRLVKASEALAIDGGEVNFPYIALHTQAPNAIGSVLAEWNDYREQA